MTSGIPLPGATGLLQRTAKTLLEQGADRWSRDGTLGPSDLASDFASAEPGGVARFNVQDARGYAGYYKCNLFAFEVARRAGFAVPLVARPRGWGFPGADGVTADASDGALRGAWARIATGESATSLDEGIRSGRRAFLLTASSPGERLGHMAVVERVHEVDFGDDGAVRRVVFDGWEAQPGGARHLVRRLWNLEGAAGGPNAHGGFDRIEVIELSAGQAGRRPEIPLAPAAGASLRDESPSRLNTGRPMDGPEEQS